MLVQSTNIPEDSSKQAMTGVVCHCPRLTCHHQSQNEESFIQADLVANQHKDEIKQPMEAPEEVPSNSELHSLLVNYINHIQV